MRLFSSSFRPKESLTLTWLSPISKAVYSKPTLCGCSEFPIKHQEKLCIQLHDVQSLSLSTRGMIIFINDSCAIIIRKHRAKLKGENEVVFNAFYSICSLSF